MRAAVELAKDWRTDRYLRRLEAMMIVADATTTLVLTGTGDVLEPEGHIMGIGSGGNFALAAAKALADQPLSAMKSPDARWLLPRRFVSIPTTTWSLNRWCLADEQFDVFLVSPCHRWHV